ncbi:unnamed protein product, partial [Symbiodinium pilosum]
MACAAGSSDVCWLCEGRDSAACVICGPPIAASSCGQSSALVSQDGWCCDDSRDERFGNWTHASVEEVNLKLLEDSEALLLAGNASAALDMAEQCCRTMEDRLSGGGRRALRYQEAKPGEIELLCLAWVQRIRSSLLQQNYKAMVDDTKKFAKLYEEIGDEPELLHKFEKQVTGASVVDQIE